MCVCVCREREAGGWARGEKESREREREQREREKEREREFREDVEEASLPVSRFSLLSLSSPDTCAGVEEMRETPPPLAGCC